MTTDKNFVVIGGGLAGAKAIEELRTGGFDGGITLVGREVERPYERPPLSKDYLTGSKDRDTIYVHDADWYAQNQVDLVLGTSVTEIDLNGHDAVTDTGRRLPFDKLLLATGSSARRLDIPGFQLEGIRYLRRVEDADQLLSDISGGGRRVVIVGGGWIGLEVAAAARGHGNEVTIVEPQATVLRAVLGDELGEVFAELHRAQGVRLLLGQGVESFAGEGGQVSRVRLTSGESVDADVVVVGVGAQPETGLAEHAGLKVDNGIVVDASLRTSHPDTFAAGDVANAFHPFLGYHVRVEHWANALNGGPAAARSMLDHPVSYDRLPYFFTDQYDLGMEFTGHIGPLGYERVVIRGDKESGAFIAFWLKDRRVIAGMNVNTWDVTDPIGDLIRSRSLIDERRLADVDVDLDDVAGATNK